MPLKSCGKLHKKLNHQTKTHQRKRFNVSKTKPKTYFCSDSKQLLQFPDFLLQQKHFSNNI